MSGTTGKAAMELMRHKTAEMTMRYTHLSMEHKRQAVQKLPQFESRILDGESLGNSLSEETPRVVGIRK